MKLKRFSSLFIVVFLAFFILFSLPFINFNVETVYASESNTWLSASQIDDASERGNGVYSYTSWLQDIKSWSDDSNDNYRCSGTRWSLEIPQGSTIQVAHTIFNIESATYDDINVNIYGEDVDNSDDYSSTQDVIGRVRTSANVDWDQDGIGTVDVQSPDISTIIQEIVDRPGWSSGNYLSILYIADIEATIKTCNTFSYDHDDHTKGWKLYVQWLNPDDPQIAEFSHSETDYFLKPLEYVRINATIRDPQGNTTFDSARLSFDGSLFAEDIVFEWTYSTDTFSEYSDPNNLSYLHTSSCFSESVNSTATKLSFYCYFTKDWGYGFHNLTSSTIVFDEDGNNGTNSEVDFIRFQSHVVFPIAIQSSSGVTNATHSLLDNSTYAHADGEDDYIVFDFGEELVNVTQIWWELSCTVTGNNWGIFGSNDLLTWTTLAYTGQTYMGLPDDDYEYTKYDSEVHTRFRYLNFSQVYGINMWDLDFIAQVQCDPIIYSDSNYKYAHELEYAYWIAEFGCDDHFNQPYDTLGINDSQGVYESAIIESGTTYPDQYLVVSFQYNVINVTSLGVQWGVTTSNGNASVYYSMDMINWTFGFNRSGIYLHQWDDRVLSNETLRYIKINCTDFGIAYITVGAIRLIGDYGLSFGDLEITNMEGCGAWIFADERWYNFQGTFIHPTDATMLDHVGLRFSDEINTFYLYYDNTLRSGLNSESFELTINPQFDVDRDPARINVEESEASIVGITLTVTWKIWPSSEIFDALDVDLYGFVNDTLGNTVSWSLESLDYFNIYNLGGLVSMDSSGSAGRRTGGDLLELYAYNNSWVQANVSYRKLQHIHFYTRLEGNKVQWDEYESDPWNFTYGLYICPKDEDWIEGWKLTVELDSVVGSWIEYPAIGDRAFYLTWNATWWYKTNGATGWTFEKADTFSSFPVWNETDTCYTAFWVDFWFNTANGSSFVGGRINAEYYGIYDTADIVIFGFGSDWGAYLGNVTQSMFFHDLEDTSGDVISARQITMMKFYGRIEQGVNPSRNNSVMLRDYDLMDYRCAEGSMVGVATPIVVATKMPEAPSGGFLAGLVSAFASIGSVFVNALTYGVLRVWPIFVGFLDIVFSFAGWENGFSQIIFWISTFLGYVVTAITYLATLLTSMFSLMAVWLVFGIQRFTEIGAGLVTVYNNLVWIYAEASAGWVDISQVVNPLLPLLPLVFFIWLLNSKDVTELIGKVTMCWTLLRSIAGIFIQIAHYTLTLVSSIIEAIPVAE